MDGSEATTARLESAENWHEWETSTCEFLIFRVLRKEHADLREQVRRVRALSKMAAERQGSKRSEVMIVGELFEDFAAELAAHMIAEESAVFPILLQLELAYVGEGPISMPTRDLEPLLRSMADQHSVTEGTLVRLRDETHGYQPPAESGLHFQELYEQLAKLDSELRRDLRIEDNILFQRATQIERELLRHGPLPGRRQAASFPEGAESR
jgi:regulator of cell morphogenesis and NO signaling